ncbi:MAG: SgcJ/EcaC family oxidoreductase [Planctomycetota bacterium]
MRRISILTISVVALTALCFGAGEEKSGPKTTVKPSVPPAAKAAVKPAEKPVARPTETVGTKPNATIAEPKPAALPASDEHAADEAAIRQTGDTYEKAYDAGDAKSIAAHFTTDAEYVDEQGNVYQGHEAIEAAMTAHFAENPGCQIEINIDSLRFVSAGVAVEDGTTAVTPKDDADPIYSRYTAVHVKTNGKWLAASVRDHAPKDRRQHRAQLQQLGWLRGDWVDEDDDSVVLFSCEAVDGGNFLLRKFTIQIAGQEAMSGTQRIGWDPLTGKLRAWIFDSEGGYAEGSWHRDDDRWVLQSTGVTADGQTASGTSIYTLVNEHTMTWQLVDHEIAGVQLPDSELVTIVRRAPLPESTDNPISSLK